MKIPSLLISKKKKKTLRASTARRSMSAPDEMDYEEMSEPNMKLSRALLIVLVLHVVAVAGIIAFNTIKSRQGAFPQGKSSSAAVESAPPAPVKSEPTTATQTALPASAMSKPPVPKDDAKIPKALPVTATEPAGNFYTVAKGDNPVSIAKKLKVSESELLTANHIDDPRKLQIGQKLIVPVAKPAKPKKSAE